MHLVCPYCEAVNRLPSERVLEGPDCGVCHKPLLTRQPVELKSTTFEKFVAKTELPVVIDFWAEWCGPCKMMAPQFAAAAEESVGRVQFGKVETDQQAALASRFGIRSIPTIVLFVSGREVTRLNGAVGKHELLAWIRAGILKSG